MKHIRPVIFLYIAVLIGFWAYTHYAVSLYGYIGLWQVGFQGVGEFQILLDLMVTSAVCMGFFVHDARQNDLNPWPSFVLTIFTGSFGPLSYLIYREFALGRRRAATDGAMPSN